MHRQMHVYPGADPKTHLADCSLFAVFALCPIPSRSPCLETLLRLDYELQLIDAGIAI